MRQRISNDSLTVSFFPYLFNIKYLNRTSIDSKLASAWQVSAPIFLRDPDDSWVNTLELFCSFSLAELRTFLLTQPAIKRVRMTLEDEAMACAKNEHDYS